MPTLVGQSGPLAGSRFELDGDVVLGRENATITLADEETSRRHAEIRVAAGVVVIEDLGSTNGTFVNGRRIDAVIQLRGDETIKVGQSTFSIEIEMAAESDVDGAATRVAIPEPAADPDLAAGLQRPAIPDTAARRAAAPLAVADVAYQPFGAFTPRVPESRRGVASRKLAPTLASMATILTTAIALVVYFAAR